jgi:hypothetical protein
MRYPLLVIVISGFLLFFCNRHETLPPAKCRFNDDCTPYEVCVGGFCRMTASMNGTVHHVKIFQKPIPAAPLLIEITIIDEKDRNDTCSPPFSRLKKVEDPMYPYGFSFNKIPAGKYMVKAYMDFNLNSNLDQGELYASNFCYAQTVKKGMIKTECSLQIIYPFCLK